MKESLEFRRQNAAVPVNSRRPDISVLSRREWLRAGLRYPVLAGLAAVGVILGLRSRNAAGLENCLEARPCQACELLRDCALPQAREARRNS